MSGPDRLLLLTNDDGADAPGLAALFRAAEGLGRRRVVAPVAPWSGKAHAVTTHGPIRAVERPDGWIATDGTPADCVRLALHHLAPGTAYVLAGINAGANLGADVHHSGTVAAVREAVLHGVPGIAVSQYIARGKPIDWDRAEATATRVLADLLAQPWEPGTFWNVNLPHDDIGAPPAEIVFCPVDPSPLPLSFRVEGETARYDGDYQQRARVPGGDIAVCFGGKVAISRVRVWA